MRRRRKPFPKDVAWNCRMSEAEKDQLRERAADQGVTMSKLVRQLIHAKYRDVFGDEAYANATTVRP